MHKVLLLNPPGKRLYIRDYYCSKVSQAGYIHHPIDLIVLSGILDKHFELSVIDAIAGNMPIENTLDAVMALRPDAVIMLMGSVSLTEDSAFLHQLRQTAPNARIICSGDIFRENGEKHLLALPMIDAALLDFTNAKIVDYLLGTLTFSSSIITRNPNFFLRRTDPQVSNKEFFCGIPRHDLFARYNYRHPFVRTKRFATTVIDYGCPFHCSFCIIKTLPYRTRPVESVIKELKFIKTLGITEVLFDTQTFGANIRHAEEICKSIIEEKLNLGWVCFSRVDITTPRVLDMMKRAGCHTVMYGIESGSAHVLEHYHKGYTPQQIHQTIDYANSIGLETVGTFILGLPEETEITIKETLDTLRRIKLDYASFNVAVPRAGTQLRRDALNLGLITDDFDEMDQSGTQVAMPTKTLLREQIRRFRQNAVLTFYFRPSYLLRRLMRIQSWQGMLRSISHALSLVRQTWLAKS